MSADKCEWNPTLSCAASEPERFTDCQNDAVISLGQTGAWHLCESCAALPRFARYRKRSRINGSNASMSIETTREQRQQMKRTPISRKSPMSRTGILSSVSFQKLRNDAQKVDTQKLKRGALKTSRPKMTSIRRAAKDQECTLRFPQVCNYDTSTTVLCHRNGAGMGMKSSDTDAVFGCFACHQVLDGHAPRPDYMTREVMLALFNDAVEITQRILQRKMSTTAKLKFGI